MSGAGLSTDWQRVAWRPLDGGAWIEIVPPLVWRAIREEIVHARGRIVVVHERDDVGGVCWLRARLAKSSPVAL